MKREKFIIEIEFDVKVRRAKKQKEKQKQEEYPIELASPARSDIGRGETVPPEHKWKAGDKFTLPVDKYEGVPPVKQGYEPVCTVVDVWRYNGHLPYTLGSKKGFVNIHYVEPKIFDKKDDGAIPFKKGDEVTIDYGKLHDTPIATTVVSCDSIQVELALDMNPALRKVYRHGEYKITKTDGSY